MNFRVKRISFFSCAHPLRKRIEVFFARLRCYFFILYTRVCECLISLASRSSATDTVARRSFSVRCTRASKLVRKIQGRVHHIRQRAQWPEILHTSSSSRRCPPCLKLMAYKQISCAYKKKTLTKYCAPKKK